MPTSTSPPCQPEGPGYDSLCGVRQEENFDSSRASDYYVPIVENPSCRWSWRECLMFPEDGRPATCDDPTNRQVVQ